MAIQFHPALRIAVAAMIAIACLAADAASSETVKMNVFERFRNEMALAHDVAAAKFMQPEALARWNSAVMPYFQIKDRQLSHFFAFAMIFPMRKDSDFYIIYFNPWIDGALLTQWRKSNQAWKVENFYLASGQRMRGEVTPQSVVSEYDILPVWLRQKGRFLRNIYAYYKYMRAQIVQTDINDYTAWFALSEQERAADLLRVKFRMRARLELAIAYLAASQAGPVLSGAFSKLKYDALTGGKARLSSYSRHADILVSLRPEVIKTLRENWYFKQNNVYSAVLSSPVAPRLFVFINVEPSGRIQGALLGDLESMASMLQAPVPLRAAKPGK